MYAFGRRAKCGGAAMNLISRLTTTLPIRIMILSYN